MAVVDDVEYNPVSVEKALRDILNEQAAGIITSRDAHEAFLKAERAAERAYARAYMAHQGPQTEKKVAAKIVPEVIAAEDDRDVKDVAYKYAKDLADHLRGKLDGMRSIGASVRKAYENAGRGDWF